MDYLRLFVFGLFVDYLKHELFWIILDYLKHGLFVDYLKHGLFEIVCLWIFVEDGGSLKPWGRKS